MTIIHRWSRPTNPDELGSRIIVPVIGDNPPDTDHEWTRESWFDTWDVTMATIAWLVERTSEEA